MRESARARERESFHSYAKWNEEINKKEPKQLVIDGEQQQQKCVRGKTKERDIHSRATKLNEKRVQITTMGQWQKMNEKQKNVHTRYENGIVVCVCAQK